MGNFNTHNDHREQQEDVSSSSQAEALQRQLRQAPELEGVDADTPEGRLQAANQMRHRSDTMIAGLPEGTVIPNEIAKEQVSQTLHRVQQRLSLMARNMARLVDATRTHQIEELQDGIPIWANIRSGRIAEEESNLLLAIQNDCKYLEDLLSKSTIGSSLNLVALKEKIGGVHRSDGWARRMGSLFPRIRAAHRDLTKGKLDEVIKVIDDLSRQVDAMDSTSMLAREPSSFNSASSAVYQNQPV
jgi:hypothetical protein